MINAGLMKIILDNSWTQVTQVHWLSTVISVIHTAFFEVSWDSACHPTTGIPNSSSSSQKPRVQWISGFAPAVGNLRLNSNSSVASVKQNRHHHHQMKFWLRGSHGLSARRAWRTLWSRPKGPQPLPPPPPPHSTSTTTLPPPPPPSKSVVSRYYPMANALFIG